MKWDKPSWGLKETSGLLWPLEPPPHGPGEGLHALGSGDPISLQAHTPRMDGASLGAVLTQTGTKQRQAPPGGQGQAGLP